MSVSARAAWISTAIFVVASSALEIFLGEPSHTAFLWHRLPGFDFVYGAGGCTLIVVVSKWLGKSFLQRPESYYDDEVPR